MAKISHIVMRYKKKKPFSSGSGFLSTDKPADGMVYTV